MKTKKHALRETQLFRRTPLAFALQTLALSLLVVDAGHAQTAPAPANPDSTVLPEVRVRSKSKSEIENARGAVNGYVATRSATATKTDTPLTETPQAISVVTSDQIRDQGARTVEEALRYTAGVQTEGAGYDLRYQSTNIRGFNATFFLDGQRTLVGGDYGAWVVDPWTLERVEVLKGPASVLYGQGSPGGIVNQVPKRPTATPVRELQVSIGSHRRRQVAFDVADGNADGTVLFRLVGLARKSNTQTDFSKDDRAFVAPSLALRLTNATKITLNADILDDRVTPKNFTYTRQLTEGPLGPVPVRNFLGEPGVDEYKRDLRSSGYLLEHEFSEKLKFEQSFRYVDSKLNYPHINQGSGSWIDDRTIDRVLFHTRSFGHGTTLDNRVVAKATTGALQHTLLAGLDYQRLSGRDDIAVSLASDLDVFNPVYGAPISAPVVQFHVSNKLQQTGLYAQDQIKIGKLVLNAGARRDLAKLVRESSVFTDTDQKDNKTTYNLGAIYALPNGVSPYASYRTSFAPAAVSAWRIPTAKPETGKQFEVGVKYAPIDSKALFTASLFDLRKRNVLTSDPNDVTNVLQTGEVRSRGIELEGKAELARTWEILGSFTYLDAEVTESNDGDKGSQFAGTSKRSLNLWAIYKLDAVVPGLHIGAGVRRASPVAQNQICGTGQCFDPTATLVDATVRYEFGRMSLALNGTNLGDKITASQGRFYNQTRNVQATFGYRW